MPCDPELRVAGMMPIQEVSLPLGGFAHPLRKIRGLIEPSAAQQPSPDPQLLRAIIELARKLIGLDQARIAHIKFLVQCIPEQQDSHLQPLIRVEPSQP